MSWSIGDNGKATRIFSVPLKRPRTERQKNASRSRASTPRGTESRGHAERVSTAPEVASSRAAASLAIATPPERTTSGGAEQVSVPSVDEDRERSPVHALGEVLGFTW